LGEGGAARRECEERSREWRRVEVEVQGPSVVGVIIRDPKRRLFDWSFGQSGAVTLDPEPETRNPKP
jgi:hypothetical protein